MKLGLLKIVSGKDRGRSLSSAQTSELRPTKALVRKAIIDIVNSILLKGALLTLDSCEILDIFAGVGTVGLEFLSNGASRAVFIERDRKCLSALKSNVENLGYSRKSKVLACPCLPALEQLRGFSFDIVFADPPYKQSVSESARVIAKLIDEKLLKKGALLVWESGDEKFPEQPEIKAFRALSLLKAKDYGDTFIFVFEHNA
jgi:16S rRNA (guanine966-N2)-methyltransferase